MKNLFPGLFFLLSAQSLSAMHFARVEGPGQRPQFAGQVVQRADFVKDIMGNTLCPTEQAIKNFLSPRVECLWGYRDYEESTLLTLNGRNLMLQPNPNLFTWLGLQAEQPEYCCGSFEQCSIRELREACNRMPRPGGGTFNVVEGVDTNWDSWFRHHVDIGALQAAPANRGAVFQVASNFNGLETVNAQQNIETQLLEQYVNDLTQGPAASISAAPGLILRHYFMYYNPNNPRATWPQTIAHQVNFLDDLQDILPVSRAGYVVLPENLDQLEQNDNGYEAIKIGYHRNVQVTHGFMLDRNRHLFIARDNPDQIINQVFTAAIDLGTTNRAHARNVAAQQLACHILHAAYEGTLRKAFIEGRRRVFLTLVGGGVFGNDLRWIFMAINRMRPFIVESGLEVTLTWRSQLNADNINVVRRCFAILVNKTGGQYQQFRNDGVYRPEVQ